MIDADLAEGVRYVYAALAMICSVGFVATLVVRWDVLRPGERILRGALIGEHLTITYGSYTALKYGYPPSIVGLLLTIWLLGIIAGFVVWIIDDLLPGNEPSFTRLPR